MRPLLTLMLLRGALPRVAVALLLLCAAAVLGLVATTVLRAPVLLRPGLLPTLVALVLPGALNLGLPLAVMGGVAALLSRWREDGVWVALQAAGTQQRALLPGLILLALVAGGSCWVLGHRVEPAAQARLGALQVSPAPGRLLQLGELSLMAEASDGTRLQGVFFAWDKAGSTLLGRAERGTWGTDGLVLEQVRAHQPGEPELRLDLERLTLRPESRRVQGVERDDRSLQALIQRMEARGRDAWAERSLLMRRDAWPAAAALLVLLAAPLALSGRSGALVLAPLLFWAAQRALDQLGAGLGPVLVAWGPSGLLGLGVLLAWVRWSLR